MLLLCANPALIQPLGHRVNDVDRASALMELYNGRRRTRSKLNKKRHLKILSSWKNITLRNEVKNDRGRRKNIFF